MFKRNDDNAKKTFGKYPSFAEFNPRPIGLEGEKKRVGEILNREILVLDYRVIKGKYNTDNCVQIQFQVEGEDKKFVVFTGSSVLQSQLEVSKERMPFRATIQRIDRYLTFS